MVAFTDAFIAKFNSRRVVDGDRCWLWTGTRDKKGYGAISIRGKKLKAHRVAYALASGEMPPSTILVCHKCDVPQCVNPSHLFLGSPADNSADMVAKSRTNRRPRAVGSRNGAAKITEATVREIRSLRSSGLSLRKIAARVGLYNTQIHNIVSGKHWRGVE